MFLQDEPHVCYVLFHLHSNVASQQFVKFVTKYNQHGRESSDFFSGLSRTTIFCVRTTFLRHEELLNQNPVWFPSASRFSQQKQFGFFLEVMERSWFQYPFV